MEREIVWVCAACGKFNAERDKAGDEACYLNAVRCYVDGLTIVNGMVTLAAETVPEVSR